MNKRTDGRGKQLCGCQCHWDLSWLQFGDTRISAGDVDGLFAVERSGHILFIETKGPLEPLTTGQRILLEALSSMNRVTVIILRGPKSFPETVTVFKRSAYAVDEPTSREDIQSRIDIWWAKANGITP